jgi:hypothetical protein
VELPAVISLADKTGNMVQDWAAAGCECYCVDIQHSIRRVRTVKVGAGLIHYVWGDLRSWWPPRRPAIGFAFTPCTDLAVSGSRDFETKGWARLRDAVDLFETARFAFRWAGCPYSLENPVGRLSTIVGEPCFIFHPCDYGDPYTKATCLWTGNGFVMPARIEPGDMFAEATAVEPTEGSKMHRVPPGADRQNIRSATPRGFARAVFEANRHLVLPPVEAVA